MVKETIQEFKMFAMRGNVMDLAVGVVIGGAFGKIVTSLVDDIIMPVIGYLIGNVDFSTLEYAGIKYGSFLNNIINFIIIALSIFFVIKNLRRLGLSTSAPLPPVPPPPKPTL